jgi:hypothetical protein
VRDQIRPEQELVAGAGLSACLTCSLCDQRCPAEVDYTGLVRKLRELAHGGQSEPQCPHGGALQSVMRMMARGGTTQDRLGWLTGDLATERERGEVFLFTGCTPYYDAFFADLEVETVAGTRAAVRLLNAVGGARGVPDELLRPDLSERRPASRAAARHGAALVAAGGTASRHRLRSACGRGGSTFRRSSRAPASRSCTSPSSSPRSSARSSSRATAPAS